MRCNNEKKNYCSLPIANKPKFTLKHDEYKYYTFQQKKG